MAPFKTENKNFQTGLNFDVRINKLPHVSYNVQKCIVPGVSFSSPTVTSNLNSYPVPGDELKYDAFEMDFIVQEGMRDWYEIWQWMEGNTIPKNFDQFKKLRINDLTNLDGSRNSPVDSTPSTYLKNTYSQISLFLSTSKVNNYMEITFNDAFPVYLSPLSLDSTAKDVDYLVGKVRFLYTNYEISIP